VSGFLPISHRADHDAEKFQLKLFGENKVVEALKKLDKLIQEEVRATAAQTLGVVSRVEKNTRVIMGSEERDRLTQEEVRATTAQTLGVVSRLEQNSQVIMDGETSHAKKEKGQLST
jgi:propanediol utilization protein